MRSILRWLVVLAVCPAVLLASCAPQTKPVPGRPPLIAPSRPAPPFRLIDVPLGKDAAPAEGTSTFRAYVADIPSAETVSAEASMAVARWPLLAMQADHLTLAHVRYTNGGSGDTSGEPPDSPKKTPVWMITFHGITDYPAGGSAREGSTTTVEPVHGMNLTVFVTDTGEDLGASEYLPGHRGR
jgi:hypothetical protein